MLVKLVATKREHEFKKLDVRFMTWTDEITFSAEGTTTKKYTEQKAFKHIFSTVHRGRDALSLKNVVKNII